MSKVILITGGIRSGKSYFAQQMATNLGSKVLFVATAQGRDEEMKEKIEKHKKERPATWHTLEIPMEVGEKIRKELKNYRVIIMDCLSMLLSNLFDKYASLSDADEAVFRQVEEKLEKELKDLETCLKEREATFIIVTNEVGMGLMPPNKLGRHYQELLGKANQRVARLCDEVYLMVSGIPVRIKPNNLYH